MTAAADENSVILTELQPYSLACLVFYLLSFSYSASHKIQFRTSKQCCWHSVYGSLPFTFLLTPVQEIQLSQHNLLQH